VISRVRALAVVYSQQPGSVFDCKMMLPKNWRADGRGWRAVLIVVAICSLTLSLATRFSVTVGSQVPAIKSQTPAIKSLDSRSGEPHRQRLDRDSTRFAAPVASCTGLEPAALYLHAVLSEPIRSNDILSLIFYNRPPPPSSLFFL
jgi:hypothetical protein